MKFGNFVSTEGEFEFGMTDLFSHQYDKAGIAADCWLRLDYRMSSSKYILNGFYAWFSVPRNFKYLDEFDLDFIE